VRISRCWSLGTVSPVIHSQAMAIPAARDPGPLVTFVLKRTVAKADSIGLVVRR
jgi:hypothetical protein